VGAISNRIARAPELGGDSMIDHITQHVGPFSIFDQPEGVASELKVVPLLVNTE
jgi:hypothetical protein